MGKLIALVVMAMGLLSGCGGSIFYVDSRFTPEEEKQIEAAQQLWADAGAEPLHLMFSQKVRGDTDARKEIVRASEREALVLHENFAKDDVNAVTRRWIPMGGINIILNLDRIEPRVFQRVMAHEFGHVHGIRVHIPGEGSVMCKIAGSDELTAEDMHLLVLAREP